MRPTRVIGLMAAVLALLASVWPVRAELLFGGMKLEGEVETGLRLLPDRPSPSRRATFEEYRDVTEGVFLPNLQLRLFRPDESYSVDFAGSKWGQDDQEFMLGAGRLGLWRFGFEWDQTPHLYSTNGRLLATETAPGVFTLSTPRPLLPAHNAARDLGPIGVRWDTARTLLDFTPTPDMDVHIEYTRTHKDGERPFGVGFGSPGNNFYEVLEPIQQTTQDFRITGTLAREQWQLQAGYAFSMFNNDRKTVVADNPCFGLSAPLGTGGCGSNDGAGAPRAGLVSLAPDNMAHTLTLAGGATLPMRTRVSSSVSYSLRLQNESFVAHTVNPTITSPDLALPQDSLDGMVGVFLLNLNATTRPLRPLTLSLKYRLFDYNDFSDEPAFAAHVVNDRTLVDEARRAHRYSYTKQNADLDARWRFGSPLAVTVGTAWERWDRVSHREVPQSDEYFAKAKADFTPADWLLVRLAYLPSFRRIDTYNTAAHLAHTVVEELTASDVAQSQSLLLRKYDEAERDRQRLDLTLQLTPTDVFSTALTGSWRNDDYLRSPLGLQDATTWSAGIDAGWTPLPSIGFSAGYVHEVTFEKQRSRSRPVTGSTTFDFPDFDWISDSTDTVDTFHLGASVRVVPRTLDWTFGASYSYALGRIETRNPLAVTSGTAAQQDAARAKPFPAFEDQLLRLDTGLVYRFWKVWTAKLGYAFESFQKNDWRTDRLNPFVPGVSSIWLGNDARNYSAHIVGVTLGYRLP
jgi:MtrB/PioB family decaheme-associated outer membrane protein